VAPRIALVRSSCRAGNVVRSSWQSASVAVVSIVVALVVLLVAFGSFYLSVFRH
jgi:hypothetical protein